jgi:hypothetical protein
VRTRWGSVRNGFSRGSARGGNHGESWLSASWCGRGGQCPERSLTRWEPGRILVKRVLVRTRWAMSGTVSHKVPHEVGTRRNPGLSASWCGRGGQCPERSLTRWEPGGEQVESRLNHILVRTRCAKCPERLCHEVGTRWGTGGIQG